MEREGVKGPYVFGLDIGTRSVIGTVGYKRDANRFVVEAMVIKEHQTRAMLDGQIHDIGKVAETIVQIKQELQEATGRKLTEVCIAAAGRVLKTVRCLAEHTFATETVINKEHVYSLDMYGVEQAYEKMRELTKKDLVGYYHVGYSVVKYYLNDYVMLNLEGHKASKISVELIATFLPDEVVDGLYAAVEAAGLKVANLTLEPIAAMNLAIPEHYRMLNLALIDVGAGTSDISIARDGSIAAFGMMPFAGDEITEAIAKNYLTDFQTAEKIKKGIFNKKTVSFRDVMGITHKVTAKEVLEGVGDTVRAIAKDLAAKMIELNGGKSVSAVFVVGGGAKIKGFVGDLAECLGLPEERVAIRGKEVLKEIDFLNEKIKKDSILVTPIGICLNFYEQKNNFIYVTVNGERVKLYDNGSLTIMDAVIQKGLPNDYLFPKRGKAIHFTVNGKKRMIRGEQGEAAVIKRNGRTAGLNTPIESGDAIMVKESTAGEMVRKEIRSLAEYKDEIEFLVNGKRVICPKYVMVNGELASGYYEIGDGDVIEFANYYTVKRILEFMDITEVGNVYVNHKPADMQDKVYENFTVEFDVGNEEADKGFMEGLAEDTSVLDGAFMNGEAPVQDEAPANEALKMEAPLMREATASNGKSIVITVNKSVITLSGKETYILVDVLDFYPFDISLAATKELVTTVNGNTAGFTAPIQDGDEVRMYWEES